jgi:DNA invertase Pin-like site-specific DNA recombinase
MTRAAIYLRVSTDRQNTENQRPEVEQLAVARGFEIIQVYEETMSAAKSRPVFEGTLAHGTNLWVEHVVNVAPPREGQGSL